MAVARDGSAQLARALDLISQIFHRDGMFLEFGRKHRIGTAFLEQQQAVWQRPDCNAEAGSANAACVLPPFNAELKPTPFAGSVAAFEAWFESWTGIDLTLPMLKTAPAWSMFKDGVVNSLILIAGALVATLGLALLFGWAQGAGSALLRWPVRLLTVTLQSSPIVLTLVIAAAIVHALFPFSDTVALGASIAALGLSNGSNAGQAISEAMLSLRAERRSRPAGSSRGRSAARRLDRGLSDQCGQGHADRELHRAPELLSALTDITSFSSGRATTYTLLLIFYTAVVMIVVWLCGRLRRLLERRRCRHDAADRPAVVELPAVVSGWHGGQFRDRHHRHRRRACARPAAGPGPSRGGVFGGVSASAIGLMRAAPTFVVMFFLLNACRATPRCSACRLRSPAP